MWLPLLVACLLTVPAAADDPAQANRLVVEAAQLIKAAEAETDASGQLALLEDAIAKLNEIIEQHPSSSLAVKLITEQPIGNLSLGKLTAVAEQLRIAVGRERQMEKKAAGGAHLAAVSKDTNFLMQIDVARLAQTSFGQDLYDVYRRFLDTGVDESTRRVMDKLFAHLGGTDWVVLAAELSHGDEGDEFAEVADEFVLQFTSDTGFDVAGMVREMNTWRAGSEDWRVREVFTEEEYPAFQVLPGQDDPFYVLPGLDSRAFFAGPSLEPLTEAMHRHASGKLIDVDSLTRLRAPNAHVSLSALIPRSLRDRLNRMDLLEQYAGTPDLPLSEIMANVFEVGQVLAEAEADRHVTVSLGLIMDTAMSANVFYVLGTALVMPLLRSMDEGLFETEPVLELDDRNLTWRFEFNGDVLLKRFETSLRDRQPAEERGADSQVPDGGNVE